MVSRDRAQLILIGALLVATVIFGLSLLLNSLLFASAGGPGSASTAVGQTETVEFEVQRSVRSLAIRVNHESRNVTADQVATALEDNLTKFSRLYAEAKAASGSTAVTVTYDNTTSTVGFRIVQAHDGDFADHTLGSNDWTPVPGPAAFPSTPTTVGWFTANVDVGNTSSGVPFVAEARNGSHEVSLSLSQNGSNLSVESEFRPPTGSPTSTTVRCGAADGRALVDLYEGNAFTGDCEFTGVGNLTGPTSIRFENVDRIVGKYSIVMNRTNSQVGTEYLTCMDGTTPRPAADADPCVAPVIWSANVTTTVQNDRLRYSNAYNLTVYPGGRR